VRLASAKRRPSRLGILRHIPRLRCLRSGSPVREIFYRESTLFSNRMTKVRLFDLKLRKRSWRGERINRYSSYKVHSLDTLLPLSFLFGDAWRIVDLTRVSRTLCRIKGFSPIYGPCPIAYRNRAPYVSPMRTHDVPLVGY